MEDKLRNYMDHLFRNIKPDRKSIELKEEILQNLIDKYHDLLAEGKTQEAAYNIALASIGDMDELLLGLQNEQSDISNHSAQQIEKSRKKSAILTSIAVMLYIISILPPILMDGTDMEEKLAPVLMFIIIAAATGILIYNSLSRVHYRRTDDSIVEEFKEWQQRTESGRNAYKAISSAIWALVVVAYIILSFCTGAWNITWVLFLIGVAVERIVKAMFELRK